MASAAMPERRTASFITIAPSWGAVKLARLPRNLPVGVLAAPTITVTCSVIVVFSCCVSTSLWICANLFPTGDILSGNQILTIFYHRDRARMRSLGQDAHPFFRQKEQTFCAKMTTRRIETLQRL